MSNHNPSNLLVDNLTFGAFCVVVRRVDGSVANGGRHFGTTAAAMRFVNVCNRRLRAGLAAEG